MNRKQVWSLLIGAACLLLAAIPALLMTALVGRQTDQTAAQRWQADSETRFAQITCFLDEDVGFVETDVMPLRQKISDALASQTSAEWIDAYSAIATASVKAGKTTVNARAICSGGDYFHFHPMELVSGSYYQDDEVNRDGVVLDMNLAWKLYGGYDLAGMELTVNGLPVTITGVVRSPQKSPEADAYGGTPTIWLSLGLLSKQNQQPSLNCYEAVLPNPVKNFAESTLKAAMSKPEDRCEYLENTSRFSFLTSLKNAWNPGARTVRTSRVIYPYWENAARLVESRCSLYAVLTVILLLYPVIYVIYRVISLLVRLNRAIHAWVKKRKLR